MPICEFYRIDSHRGKHVQEKKKLLSIVHIIAYSFWVNSVKQKLPPCSTACSVSNYSMSKSKDHRRKKQHRHPPWLFQMKPWDRRWSFNLQIWIDRENTSFDRKKNDGNDGTECNRSEVWSMWKSRAITQRINTYHQKLKRISLIANTNQIIDSKKGQ